MNPAVGGNPIRDIRDIVKASAISGLRYPSLLNEVMSAPFFCCVIVFMQTNAIPVISRDDTR